MKAFWRALAPRRVFVAGWVVYALLFAIAPVDVNWQIIPIKGSTLLLLFFCILGFFLGTYALGKNKVEQIALPEHVGRKTSYPLFWLVLGIGVVGGAFRVYDRYILRGLAEATTYFEQSEVLSLHETSVFGILAGPMFPFLLLMPFAYMLYARNVGSNRLLFAVSVVCLAFIPMEAALTGSRSSTLVAGGLILLTLASQVKITPTKIALSVIAAVLFILLAGEIFIQRVVEFGSYSVAESAGGGSGYAQTVPASDWIINQVGSVEDAGIGARFLFSILHFSQYYLHGFFEYFRLVDEFSDEHSLGAYTYPLSYRVLALIFQFPPTAADINPRAGVFSTFFGGLYLDFGWFSPVVCFAYGWFSQLCWYYAASKNVFLRPFYFMVVIAIFFSSVADLTNSSISSYVLASASLLIIFGHMLRTQPIYGGMQDEQMISRLVSSGNKQD